MGPSESWLRRARPALPFSSRYDGVVTTPSFEQGPIRPPSEAHSLLVRVIRNCTWNRCTFCPVYKGSESSLRDVDDVLADVEAMAAAAERLRAAAADGRGLTAPLYAGEVPPEAVQVARFLDDGGRSVFLQDADPCAVKPERLAAVVRRVRELFPTVTRVTTYGRAATLARRRPEQLRLLAAAGLDRVHLGMESGSDEVLAFVEKGCTAEQLVTAGRQVLAAGMELCFYVMPGLGGRRLQEQHVTGTAAVLRAVAAAAPAGRPLVVRLRTTAVVPGTPLAQQRDAGLFKLPDDVEAAAELRSLLEQLEGVRLELRSDHALNLLPQLAGSLPADRDRLLGLLDEFLGLTAAERAEFAVGCRLGVYRALADRHDPDRREQLRAHLGARLGGEVTDEVLLAAAADLRARFL